MNIPPRLPVRNIVQNISTAKTIWERSQSRGSVIWLRHFLIDNSDDVGGDTIVDNVGFNHGKTIEQQSATIANNK
jgi:hypothetical protein